MKFPFAAVELDSGGSVHDPAQLEAARQSSTELMMFSSWSTAGTTTCLPHAIYTKS